MHRFFLAAVDIVPAAIVLIPVFTVLFVTSYGCDLKKSVLYCLFCLYLSAVFVLVGIPNVTYFRPEVNLNLIPLVSMIDDLKNSILNVLLFAPLGCFLPVLWLKFRKLSTCVGFGFSLSLAIELLQMLTFRVTDVNDLITNTVGTLLGFLLVKRLITNTSTMGEGSRDVLLMTALPFCVMFFIHPFLSPLIWDKVL